jgi:F-type H+-transporting ATPase subunit b
MKHRTRQRRSQELAARCGATFLFLALLAVPTFAQGGETPAADTTVGWIFRWLNFAIVFGGIAYMLATKASPVFRQRAEAIAQAIGEAARARDAAEQQRRETAAKLANLQNEVVEMRAAAKRDAEAEAQRLRALAKSEAEKIEQIAQAEIRAAERASQLELKALAARLAVERAEAILVQQMTPKTDAALVQTFVAELGRDVN